MAKKKKLTKEEISGPDAFQSAAETVSKFLHDNWKIFAVGLGALAIVGVGLVGYQGVQQAGEEAAQAELYPALKSLADIERELLQLEQKPAKEDKKDSAETKPKKSKDELDSELDSKAKALTALIQQHKGTKSAEIASLNLTGFLIDKEKYESAASILTELIPQTKKGSASFGIARSQLASALSHLGQTEKAIGMLQEIIADPKLSYFHGDSLVKLGVLQMEAGDADGARSSLLRAKTEFSNVTSGKVAGKYLRWIEYKDSRK